MVLLAMATLAVLGGPADDVKLGPDAPLLVGDAEPQPIRRAVEDLRRDLAKAFGRDTPFVTKASALGREPAIVVTCSDPETARFRDASVRGREAHAVTLRDYGGAPHVVLQGADTRGTIYAIYTFCDRFLDVPPLWFWASWEPRRVEAVVVPKGTNLRFGSPHVPWRAWFPNDQDLLRGWPYAAGSIEKRYEAMLETMLRLKLNVIDVGTIRDYPTTSTELRLARMARARGIAVTTTHNRPLGSGLGWWDEYWRTVRNTEPPPISCRDPGKLEEFWTYHIELAQREQLEMIWSIGFRAHLDRGFWEEMPDAPRDDAGRADVIRDMMDRQVALVNRLVGPQATMRTVLYNECSDYFAAGLLRPPDAPNLIWNFCSARRDHFPAADLRGYVPPADRQIGYYMNLQFTSTGSHLAQGEGPWKMARNFRMVEDAGRGPLTFSVLNAGNIREFVLGLSANAAMMWDLDGFDADRFMRAFCVRYFGDEQGQELAALYWDFFDSYWQQKRPDIEGFERQYIFHDQRIARAGRDLLRALRRRQFEANALDERGMGWYRIVPADSGTETQLEAVIKGTEASARKLRSITSACDSVVEKLPAQGRTFFNDNLRVQAHFMLQANLWLNALARAMAGFPDGGLCLAEAEEHAEAMRSALAEAEHGVFEGWYSGDEKFGVADRLAETRTARAQFR